MKERPPVSVDQERVKSFYIGRGALLSYIFKTLKAKVCVMSLVDFGKGHLFRSEESVHYVHVFHALSSTHVAFNQNGHSYYDTILCPGPIHKKELQLTEELYSLPNKRLIEVGYPRLDEMYKKKGKIRREIKQKMTVLIAPTWGQFSISNNCLEDVINSFINNDFIVIYRPHYMTIKNEFKIIEKVLKKFEENENFKYLDSAFRDELDTIDLFISDWSSAAFTYAFSYERPVMFINTPQKILNTEYEKVGLEAIEKKLRNEIGVVAEMDQFAEFYKIGLELINSSEDYIEKIKEIRGQYIYNLGTSLAVAGDEIIYLIESHGESI
tara:strand:+ start:90291 stop:91265 length:975 start_codon:yes stop_codon:yes gene_type:complete